MKDCKIIPETAPTGKEIIFCISLYYGIPKKFHWSSPLFKMYLSDIVEKRFFIETITNPIEKSVFKMYLSSQITKREISLIETKKTTSGVYLINRSLKRLVSEIMQDYKAGLLEIQSYEKPLTKRQIIKNANRYLQEIGIKERIPLRKKSNKELLKDWKNFTKKFE